ncbi:MAG: BolA family transcriptional regulator [Alphaproteobacteria bacterium]|nr:BolA family transcriptional regulator [Alphaproteobacteria bacterium]
MENIIRQKLTAALGPMIVEIANVSERHAGHEEMPKGKNTHFRIKATSTAFSGLSRLERHRLVYDILNEELNGTIHALSLSLLAPNEKK